MFREVSTDKPNVLGAELNGTVTKADLEEFHAWLHHRLAAASKPALVVLMDRFEGYAGASAMLEDLRIDTKHHDDLSRVALITDETWLKWSTILAKPFTKAELKWFAPGDRNAAFAWAGGAS